MKRERERERERETNEWDDPQTAMKGTRIENKTTTG